MIPTREEIEQQIDIAELDRLRSEYAKAKADRRYVEEGKKSLLSVIASECQLGSEAARERHARGDQRYMDMLKTFREAVKAEADADFALESIKIKVQVWQTLCANERREYAQR